jgi:two-component system CAI-1 autoinducer sensor kinase/phosphatase CqsS
LATRRHKPEFQQGILIAMNAFRKLSACAARMYGSIERSVQYSEPRFLAFGTIAVVGFPLYYFVWHTLFPQPYENLGLRILGSLLFLPLMFAKRWPSWARRFLTVYWYLAILYALPFFFTFMLLKNGDSTAWLMSALVAVFLMILLLDWLNLVFQFVLGSGLAWLAYFLTTEASQLSPHYVEYLPIYLFAITLGSVANFSSEALKQERLRAMLAAASNIAHELRTPLLGIKSGAAGLQQYLPTLLDAYHLAHKHGLPVTPVRTAHLNSMRGVLARIEAEANYSNTIIDMLLMNARSAGFKRENSAHYSMAQCVEAALKRYPFASAKERSLVIWDNSEDFSFRGSDLLMTHVLFNLLKNALYYIAKAGKGEIVIRLEPSSHGNRLVFRDTGSGIPPEVLPHIFSRFYSWAIDEDGLGTGIGLAFCRAVMESFGGSIACRSSYGEFAEFVMTFPVEHRS